MQDNTQDHAFVHFKLAYSNAEVWVKCKQGARFRFVLRNLCEKLDLPFEDAEFEMLGNERLAVPRITTQDLEDKVITVREHYSTIQQLYQCHNLLGDMRIICQAEKLEHNHLSEMARQLTVEQSTYELYHAAALRAIRKMLQNQRRDGARQMAANREAVKRSRDDIRRAAQALNDQKAHRLNHAAALRSIRNMLKQQTRDGESQMAKNKADAEQSRGRANASRRKIDSLEAGCIQLQADCEALKERMAVEATKDIEDEMQVHHEDLLHRMGLGHTGAPVNPDGRECFICAHPLVRNFALFPCGHGDLCAYCAQTRVLKGARSACPVCRNTVTHVHQIFVK
jgi:hypothetical protein